MIPAERSCRRSSGLLLSNHALAFSTMERTTAEAGAVLGVDLANARLDALAQTEPAVVGAMVPGIGEQASDLGADHQSQAQQLGKHPGVMNVRGRGQRTQR